MATSQREDVIRLIRKKAKDLSCLKNWRPLSVLNVDYKIATKALASRLKKGLSQIISNAKTGLLKVDLWDISDIIIKLCK